MNMKPASESPQESSRVVNGGLGPGTPSPQLLAPFQKRMERRFVNRKYSPTKIWNLTVIPKATHSYPKENMKWCFFVSSKNGSGIARKYSCIFRLWKAGNSRERSCIWPVMPLKKPKEAKCQHPASITKPGCWQRGEDQFAWIE